jgi:hypothetical protein
VSLWLIAGGVSAQVVNPELGDVSAQGQVSAQSTTTSQTTTAVPPEPVAATTTTTTTETTTVIPNRYVDTDHGSVVGHFGVGFFGVLAVPVGGLDQDGDPDNGATVSAPTIGIRYWLQDALAIEAALGIGIQSGGTTIETGNATTHANGPSVFALALHGGLPLVFAASKHFAFEVIPELNIGFSTGGIDDETMANQDRDLSGFLFEIGGRVGAEIQFGFIDIPQLALQATVGLHLRYEGRGQSVGDEDISNSQFRFGTTVQDEPWEIFGGNISAIYYF